MRLNPYPLFVGLRYAGAKSRSQLVSFISLVAMVGMTVGVALLIVVLSVMNGFDQEMRNRILGLVPHITIKSYQQDADWSLIESLAMRHKEVSAVAPFAQINGMVLRGTDVESVLIYGIDALREQQVSIIGRFVEEQALLTLQGQSESIIMGSALAERLAISVGDGVTIMIPQENPNGQLTPKFKRLTLTALFKTGTELDQSVALMSLATASELVAGDVSAKGLRILLHDTFTAPRVAWEIEQNLPYGFVTRDWTRTHGNLYSAIQLSKQLVVLMLFVIIAVAAFNVVSALVMIVTDKRADIAILRTLGASPKQILAVFMVQGTFIGIIGTSVGVILGVLMSLSMPDIVNWIQLTFHHQFLNSDVYPIDYLPIDLRFDDIARVVFIAIAMSVFATLYPAWRAAKVTPADALRYQ